MKATTRERHGFIWWRKAQNHTGGRIRSKGHKVEPSSARRVPFVKEGVDQGNRSFSTGGVIFPENDFRRKFSGKGVLRKNAATPLLPLIFRRM